MASGVVNRTLSSRIGCCRSIIMVFPFCSGGLDPYKWNVNRTKAEIFRLICLSPASFFRKVLRSNQLRVFIVVMRFFRCGRIAGGFRHLAGPVEVGPTLGSGTNWSQFWQPRLSKRYQLDLACLFKRTYQSCRSLLRLCKSCWTNWGHPEPPAREHGRIYRSFDGC